MICSWKRKFQSSYPLHWTKQAITVDSPPAIISFTAYWSSSIFLFGWSLLYILVTFLCLFEIKTSSLPSFYFWQVVKYCFCFISYHETHLSGLVSCCWLWRVEGGIYLYLSLLLVWRVAMKLESYKVIRYTSLSTVCFTSFSYINTTPRLLEIFITPRRWLPKPWANASQSIVSKSHKMPIFHISLPTRPHL